MATSHMKNRGENKGVLRHSFMQHIYTEVLQHVRPVLGTKDTDVDKTSAFRKSMFWLEERDNKQAHRS